MYKLLPRLYTENARRYALYLFNGFGNRHKSNTNQLRSVIQMRMEHSREHVMLKNVGVIIIFFCPYHILHHLRSFFMIEF